MMKATSISNPANSVILNAVCRLGGGRTTYQSIDYGANNALAAPKPDAAFLLCTDLGASDINQLKIYKIMNKTNQFSAKAQYVTPSCKNVKLQTRGIVCRSPSYGDKGKAGKSVTWDEYYDEF